MEMACYPPLGAFKGLYRERIQNRRSGSFYRHIFRTAGLIRFDSIVSSKVISLPRKISFIAPGD